MAGSGDCPLMTDSKDGDPGSPTNRPDEPPGGAGLEVGLRLGPVPGFPTSLAAASDQSPVTAERIADAFESFARKLAKAGVPLDRIPEGLSVAAVRGNSRTEKTSCTNFGTPWRVGVSR